MRNLFVVIVVSVVTSFLTIAVMEGDLVEDAPEIVEGVEERIVRSVREESRVIAAVSHAQDAVVSVIISKDLPVMEQYFEEFGSPFDSFGFFGNSFGFRIPRYRQNGTERQEVGGGTAFFIHEDGLLLTNKHVVDDPDADYTVLLNDGSRLDAVVVATDPGNDIALLTVDTEDHPYLDLSTSALQLGQTVIAIGNALAEFRNTVSVGVVSGLKRSVLAGAGRRAEQLERIIQTDAAINQGNSGGPLLNTSGEVIGMNTAVAAGAQNIGFAIPASDLIRALESYQEYGRIVKPYLGVRYLMINSQIAEANNLSYDYGALVLRGEDVSDLAVIPGSPADIAGIEENDIILEVNGEKLTSQYTLSSAIGRLQPGEEVTLRIVHDGEEREVIVVLEES